ncbi:MAG: hypothetical protein JSR83_15820 [Proteobacteria bacterium]|nr:hypothetical protein [Pseudomonadota bacterium]
MSAGPFWRYTDDGTKRICVHCGAAFPLAFTPFIPEREAPERDIEAQSRPVIASQTFHWFLQLAGTPNTPDEVAKFADELRTTVTPNNARVQTNRVFRRRGPAVRAALVWLTAPDLLDAIKAKGCTLTSETHEATVTAFRQIVDGDLPTEALGMVQQRGRDVGLPVTQEAAAFVEYLVTAKGGGYSRNRAEEIAAQLFKVRADGIRKHAGIAAMNETSAAALALWGLARIHGANPGAVDAVTDLDALKEAATWRPSEW